MSRTLLAILLAAGLCILFVVFKFLGVRTQDLGGSNSQKTASEEASSEYSSWVVFVPETQTFKASFPTQPQHISQSTPDAFNRFVKHYEIYGSEGIDKSGFMIQAITYSNGSDPAEDKGILENTLADFLATSSVNQLQSSEKTTFNEQKALKFEINSGQKRMSGIIFVLNKTLYVLTRIVPLEDKNDTEDFQYFINSFKIQPAENKNLKEENPKV